MLTNRFENTVQWPFVPASKRIVFTVIFVYAELFACTYNFLLLWNRINFHLFCYSKNQIRLFLRFSFLLSFFSIFRQTHKAKHHILLTDFALLTISLNFLTLFRFVFSLSISPCFSFSIDMYPSQFLQFSLFSFSFGYSTIFWIAFSTSREITKCVGCE